MIRIEVKRGEAIIHVDDDGIEALTDACGEAAGGRKVILGDPGAALILRHVEFGGTQEQADAILAESADAADVGGAWAVIAGAELSPSSDELALLAIWEAMRLMLASPDGSVRDRGRSGLRGVLQITVEALREHDPAALDGLVEQWRPQAEKAGLEW